MSPELRDKAKIHHLGQVFQKVESLGQNLLIKKIAKEGIVGAAFFDYGRPQQFLLNITISYLVSQIIFE
jgi:hypothetical protein